MNRRSTRIYFGQFGPKSMTLNSSQSWAIEWSYTIATVGGFLLPIVVGTLATISAVVLFWRYGFTLTGRNADFDVSNSGLKFSAPLILVIIALSFVALYFMTTNRTIQFTSSAEVGRPVGDPFCGSANAGVANVLLLSFDGASISTEASNLNDMLREWSPEKPLGDGFKDDLNAILSKKPEATEQIRKSLLRISLKRDEVELYCDVANGRRSKGDLTQRESVLYTQVARLVERR